MKYEIITLENVQIIGMVKEIAFCKGQEECPKFWGEYVERIIKPVFMEHKAPDAFQQAAIDNGVGEFGLCTCDIPNHNCATCWEANFGACSKNTFTYVIGGIYKGGGVPEGMKLFPIHSGKWLKMHFEGGMKAFQEQYQMFYKEWLPQHSEFHCPNNAMTMEWYNGTDIESPDYQCGVMMPLENLTNKDIMDQKFCQSCGMPLTEDVLGTNADGSKNEDYCMYCYKDGQFLQDCTMEEMIEHCAQFVNAVNEGLEKPISKEEYIGMMKTYFPQLKRWRKTLDVNNDEAMNVNPALAGIKELIAQMADKLPIAYISSVDQEGFPWTKAMLKPRKREGIKTFYFTTNTFSIRVAQYKANPKASIYFCDTKGFKGMMLRGTMEVLTDAASKEMIWHNGDEQYYPGGVTDPNYCVLKFTATDGRFYSDFYPRSFVIE